MIATAIGPKNTERVSGIMARMAASIDIKVKGARVGLFPNPVDAEPKLS